MQLSTANDVKVYNLSAGKSLPEWLEERERRKKAGKPATAGGDSRKNIQLLQELEMPVVSTRMEASKDGRFLCAVGTYKPRVRCYEVEQLGLKFERCFDSEVVAFEMLSDDYSKMVFLHCDRYVEIHAQFGRYYRLRIPHFGRDLAYHPQSCDVYFAGDKSNVTRLNLEQGRFLSPYETESPENNVCVVNPDHQLLLVGGVGGVVEAWDPRSKHRVGSLDCLKSLDPSDFEGKMPEVTSLCCRDGLSMAVGTSSGHVQLFDLRSSDPVLVKDHMYGLPIKKVAFHSTHDQVLSLDAKCVKIWERQSGKPYVAVESEHELNDLVVYPGSGLLFMANEQPRMQAHFIPSLGPAPNWCSFLDTLTEEMEEDEVTEVYDDYKFVTKEKLVDLGLDHLIGSPLLRAYMHGYFMDVRLYKKAESLMKPTTSLAESNIRKRMEEARKKRVELKQKLPSVNKDLYLKLKDLEVNSDKRKKKNQGTSLLQDDRFQEMFKDPRFAVDTTEEAYRLLNPVLSRLDESRMQKLEEQFEKVDDDEEEEEEEEKEDSDIYSDTESTDEGDEVSPVKRKSTTTRHIPNPELKSNPAKVSFYELKDGFSPVDEGRSRKDSKVPLERRLATDGETGRVSVLSGHQMTFTRKESKKQVQERMELKEHMRERAAVRRSTKGLRGKKKELG